VLSHAGAGFVAALVVVTILAKLGGCALGSAGLSWRDRLTAGAGMVPRAEVTLAVAIAATAAGKVPPEVFAALVAAVLASALVGPALVQAALPGRSPFARRDAETPPEGSGREPRERG
jgi:Kef-type K+ transport system membrane component KefB